MCRGPGTSSPPFQSPAEMPLGAAGVDPCQEVPCRALLSPLALRVSSCRILSICANCWPPTSKSTESAEIDKKRTPFPTGPARPLPAPRSQPPARAVDSCRFLSISAGDGNAIQNSTGIDKKRHAAQARKAGSGIGFPGTGHTQLAPCWLMARSTRAGHAIASRVRMAHGPAFSGASVRALGSRFKMSTAWLRLLAVQVHCLRRRASLRSL